MFNFLKKKKLKEKEKNLEEALKLGLITEEEFLRLCSERADKKLKDFLKKKK